MREDLLGRCLVKARWEHRVEEEEGRERGLEETKKKRNVKEKGRRRRRWEELGGRVTSMGEGEERRKGRR